MKRIWIFVLALGLVAWLRSPTVAQGVGPGGLSGWGGGFGGAVAPGYGGYGFGPGVGFGQGFGGGAVPHGVGIYPGSNPYYGGGYRSYSYPYGIGYPGATTPVASVQMSPLMGAIRRTTGRRDAWRR